MKIFKNGQEFTQEPLKEIEFYFCFRPNEGLSEISSKDLVVGISDYVNSFKNIKCVEFKKFELIGKFSYCNRNYDLIKATYFNLGAEENILLLGKFNDGVINIKDHNIEIVATKKDFEKKKLKPISFLHKGDGSKLEPTFFYQASCHNKIEEIHCHEKVFFKDRILDLIIIKWVNGVCSPETDTSVYYGHFNDGVL